MEGLADRMGAFGKTIRRDALGPALRSPAAWTFLAVWLAAATYLAITGHASTSLVWLGIVIGLGLFLVLTVALTTGARQHATEGQDPPRSTLLWLQVALLVAVSLLTAQLVPSVLNYIPLWSPFVRFLQEAAQWLVQAGYLKNPNYLVNPVLFFVVPFPLLLLLGARWRSLGFGRGHCTWRIVALWSIGVVGYWIFNLITGNWSIGRLGHTLLSNAMKNGFWEEFLFRGALQTRLTRLISPSWGLVISSLGFGLWHIATNMRQLEGDFLAGAAMSILVQGSLGLALGVIFLRTHNLLACSVIHVVMNTT